MATVTLQNGAAVEPEEKTLTLVRPKESIREDWPNEAGFQTLHEERTPVELRTDGAIPAYAAGSLYRTGPASYKVDRGKKGEYALSHWFDGFGHTHRFEIVPQDDGITKVFYNSRRQNDALIEQIKERGKYGYITFGQKKDPCIGLFGKIMSAFEGSPKDPQLANIPVAIKPNMPGLPSAPGHTRKVQNLWTTSDNAQYKSYDPSTLEPIGLASQQVLHPSLKGPLSCAHAQTDPVTGDIFNYNLTVGPMQVYRVFKVSATTGKTDILATIPGRKAKPAYLHSFFLTEDFVILCIWSSHFDGSMGLKIVAEQNILDAITPWDASRKTRWFVIDRKHGKGVVSEFESEAKFCFHTVNAWQVKKDDGKTDIVCDFAEYENLDILQALYYTNLTSEGKDAITFQTKSGESSLPTVVRYRLSDVEHQPEKGSLPKAEKVISIPKGQAGDLPAMNPNFKTKESRFIYSVILRGYSTFFDGLSKVDMQTKEVICWDNPKGHTPGEPIFVPNPEGTAEDDGILLSVVLDGFTEKSYLVCLDARTMKQLGRADCDWAVGFGFHGAHI